MADGHGHGQKIGQKLGRETGLEIWQEIDNLVGSWPSGCWCKRSTLGKEANLLEGACLTLHSLAPIGTRCPKAARASGTPVNTRWDLFKSPVDTRWQAMPGKLCIGQPCPGKLCFFARVACGRCCGLRSSLVF